ncbi:hypothetical protein BGZ65_001208 [Modicella reniformis]|uniref:Calpain catalytic domain-containing protein n=1 Tax=Modicella reniformis TaxID=1440133 RepID=A0A9P6MBP1_9FUNG|nr:hypothetical protein BGZ65_001208 [Modicella reniformis]
MELTRKALGRTCVRNLKKIYLPNTVEEIEDEGERECEHVDDMGSSWTVLQEIKMRHSGTLECLSLCFDGLNKEEPLQTDWAVSYSNGVLLGRLYAEAYPLAIQATRAEADGDYYTAKLHYGEVCEIFNKILKQLAPGQEEYELVIRKLDQYTKRAEDVFESSDAAIIGSSAPIKANEPLPEYARFEQEAKTAYEQAVAEQRKRHEHEALEFYIRSADLYSQAWKTAPEDYPGRMMLRQMLEQVLTIATDLKGVNSQSLPNVKSGSIPVHSGPVKFTLQEIKVLKDTSEVNGIIYIPWSDDDIGSLFRDKVLFEDPNGKLALSPAQERNFGSWKRASEIMTNPKMVHMVSSANIVQEYVTDCSFVASLCVSANYERRTKKRLIRACIYPKDESGEPCYNPYGQYLVNLIFNGISRRIVVDDFLPVSKTGELMCTCSRVKNELWPSIIEKAYMKVMGGYNFPGSNSSTDLFALTGWIPEHIFIEGCDREATWERILSGHRNDLALVTIATGSMDEEIGEEKGLVPTHAYAVLNMRRVNDLRLLMVKNPWSRKSWKGRFSRLDTDSWTEGLKKELEYDQAAALEDDDDGIFWIDYESVCEEFHTIHINWDPEAMKHRTTIHLPWVYKDGPRHDKRNLGNNPQFSLQTNVKDSSQCTVWMLLSKHITKTEEENLDYNALHIFDIEGMKKDPAYLHTVSAASTPDNSATKPGSSGSSGSSSKHPPKSWQQTQREGIRIYHEDGAIHKSSYVNSQHILVRINAPLGVNEYTAVLSQQLKTRDLYFTLRVLASCEFDLKEVPFKYTMKKEIKGEWTEETSGGNRCCAGYMNNPQYRLVVPKLPAPQTITPVLFTLKSQSTIPLLVQLINNKGDRVSCLSSQDLITQTNEYRRGFNYSETKDLRPDTYTVVVSAYDPGYTGRYTLTMQSQVKMSLTPIPAEGAGMFRKKIEAQWARGRHRVKDLSYARNPYYVAHVTEMTTIMVRLQIPGVREMTGDVPALQVDIYVRLEDGVVGNRICTTAFAAIPQGVVTPPKSLPGNDHGYLIVLSTVDINLMGEFVLIVYSDREVVVEAMMDVLR